MQFELHPSVTLTSNTFNVLVAPPGMLIDAINNNPSFQRFKILYVPGNYSQVLSRLHRTTEMDIRRAFTAFQLTTVLEENQHTLVIIEHDPLLFEDQNELQDYVSMTMKQSATAATILLYAPGMDSSLEEIASRADRIFYFEPVIAARQKSKLRQKGATENQITLEAF
jgi:DNA polymerase I